MARLTTFRHGDAESLPFDDGVFDAIISECSFCSFPGKTAAAMEMARVLRAGGRLGLADMTVNGPMPSDLQKLLGWVACIAGAGSPEAYVAALQQAGFTNFIVEDRRDALLDMVDGIRRRMTGVELVALLGNLAEIFDVAEAKRLALRAVQLIESGVVGYTIIAAEKAATTG